MPFREKAGLITDILFPEVQTKSQGGRRNINLLIHKTRTPIDLFRYVVHRNIGDHKDGEKKKKGPEIQLKIQLNSYIQLKIHKMVIDTKRPQCAD